MTQRENPTPYAQGARAYRDAGWPWPITTPQHAKEPLPAGVTGRDGNEVSDALAEAWIAGRPLGTSFPPFNLGLRLPRGVVALDIEYYKEGRADLLAPLLERWALPPTWMSSSRDDGSGLYLYSVPADVELRNVDGLDCVVQWFHRYVTAWPSVHPDTGRPYRWTHAGTGGTHEGPVPFGSWAELPPAALADLTAPVGSNGTTSNRPRPTGGWAGEVRLALGDALAALGPGAVASRHETVTPIVMRLVSLEEGGFPGAGEALATLERAYLDAVAGDRGGPRVAAEEWRRMVDGARVKVTPVTWEERQAERDMNGLVVDTSNPADATAEADQPPARPAILAQYAHLGFPIDVLPPTCAEFVAATAASLSVHQGTVATMMLPVAGAALGNVWAFRPQADWQEQANLWGAVIAAPSVRKSPVEKRVVAPLWAIQNELDRRHREALAEWGQDDPKARGAEPQRADLVLVDYTTEALADALEVHQRGVLLSQDELSGFIGALNQYKDGKGNDRSLHLSFWSRSPWRVRRRTRHVFIPSPYVGVVGGVQPDVAHLLLDGRDGLPYRFLYKYQPKIRKRVADPVPYELTARYENLIQGLYDLAPLTVGDKTVPLEVPYADDNARRTLHVALDGIYREQFEEGLPDQLVDYWGKLEAYLARFALVLAAMWHVDTGAEAKVTTATVERASKLIDYYKGQAILVFEQGVQTPPARYQSGGPAHVELLVGWLRQQQGRDVTRRTLRRYGPRRLRALGLPELEKVIQDAVYQDLVIVAKKTMSNGRGATVLSAV